MYDYFTKNDFNKMYSLYGQQRDCWLICNRVHLLDLSTNWPLYSTLYR